MPFLSKIHINPARKTGREMLRNPHLVHGMVLHGIPGEPTGERTLWRLDSPNPYRPHLLVLTDTKPDWTHITEQAGWPQSDSEHFAIRDYNTLFAHLATGREFAFRLTANPVENTMTPVKPTAAQQRRRAAGETRGFRISHRTAAHQLDWLLRRTDTCGFTIPPARTATPAPGLGETPTPASDVRIVAREQRRFHKKTNGSDAKGRLITLTTVTFEGRLAVTDPAVLRDKLLTGIGPAKAYGCGLLTLAPLPGRRDG
jgi:CRISPR system Cascade subunit CasE